MIIDGLWGEGYFRVTPPSGQTRKYLNSLDSCSDELLLEFFKENPDKLNYIITNLRKDKINKILNK